MSQQLYEFSGMPGVRARRIKGPLVNSISGFMAALGKHRLCSAAGDHGSVTVYRDDDGNYRCWFQRFHSTVDGQIFDTKTRVRA